jgi:hypothetical protein
MSLKRPRSRAEPQWVSARDLRGQWRTLAASGALLLGLGLLAAAIVGFTAGSSGHEAAKPVAPPAPVTLATYARGHGITYLAPAEAFAVALPHAPAVVHGQTVAHFAAHSFVTIGRVTGVAPDQSSLGDALWLHAFADRLAGATRATVLRQTDGLLASGDRYDDVVERAKDGRTAVIAEVRLIAHGRDVFTLELVDRREQHAAFVRLVASFRLGLPPGALENATTEDRTGAFGTFNALTQLTTWTAADGSVQVAMPRRPTVTRGVGAGSQWQDAVSAPDGQHHVEIVVTSYDDPLGSMADQAATAASYEHEVVHGVAGRVLSSHAGRLAGGQPYVDFTLTYANNGTVHRRARVVVEPNLTVLVYVDDAAGDAPATFAHVVDSLHAGGS